MCRQLAMMASNRSVSSRHQARFPYPDLITRRFRKLMQMFRPTEVRFVGFWIALAQVFRQRFLNPW